MNNQSISIVLVRLGAITVLLSSVYVLAANYTSFFVDGLSMTAKISMFVLTFVLPLIIAMFIWRFPATLLSKVAPESQDVDASGISAEQLMVVGTALLGLYVLVFGLLDVMYWESVVISERSLFEYYDTSEFESPPGIVAARVVSYGQVVLGLALILGRRGITQVVLKLRGRG